LLQRAASLLYWNEVAKIVIIATFSHDKGESGACSGKILARSAETLGNSAF
jgi:hypothetical protein